MQREIPAQERKTGQSGRRSRIRRAEPKRRNTGAREEQELGAEKRAFDDSGRKRLIDRLGESGRVRERERDGEEIEKRGEARERERERSVGEKSERAEVEVQVEVASGSGRGSGKERRRRRRRARRRRRRDTVEEDRSVTPRANGEAETRAERAVRAKREIGAERERAEKSERRERREEEKKKNRRKKKRKRESEKASSPEKTSRRIRIYFSVFKKQVYLSAILLNLNDNKKQAQLPSTIYRRVALCCYVLS